MTTARIAELTRQIAELARRISEIDEQLAQPLTPDTRYRLQGERRELNSERSALETARFLHPFAWLRFA